MNIRLFNDDLQKELDTYYNYGKDVSTRYYHRLRIINFKKLIDGIKLPQNAKVLRHIEATRKYVNISPVVLDKEVLSNVYSLPLEKRRNCYLAKRIIKRHNPKLLSIPYSYSGYMIPLAFPYIIHQGLRLIHTRGRRKFFGQSDVAYHIRYTLKDLVESKINALNINLINRDMANKLLKEHLSDKQYHTNAICRLVTLSVRLENSMEGGCDDENLLYR